MVAEQYYVVRTVGSSIQRNKPSDLGLVTGQNRLVDWVSQERGLDQGYASRVEAKIVSWVKGRGSKKAKRQTGARDQVAKVAAQRTVTTP